MIIKSCKSQRKVQGDIFREQQAQKEILPRTIKQALIHESAEGKKKVI